MERVTIAIASCGRASLLDTLQSLARMGLPPGVVVDVLIADDDRGGAAARVAARAPSTLPLKTIAVAAGNVSIARNACLEGAEGEWIAFVDDDEWVEPDWLARLLAAQKDLGADVVVGPVFPRYPSETPAWIIAANPLYVEWGERGKRLETGRSGNVLIRRSIIVEKHLRFDPALGPEGGEDTDFFHRMHRAGARIFATDDAIAHEHVAAERFATPFMKKRALRSGRSYARTRLAAAGRLQEATFRLDAATKALVGWILSALLQPISKAHALRFAQKSWLNRGKLSYTRVVSD